VANKLAYMQQMHNVQLIRVKLPFLSDDMPKKSKPQTMGSESSEVECGTFCASKLGSELRAQSAKKAGGEAIKMPQVNEL